MRRACNAGVCDLDIAKFRNIFLEDATDHLSDLSGGLLALEKNAADRDALDLVFRMVHSIKGMAASLEFDACTELAHTMEDRLGGYRDRERIDEADGLPLLFRGLSRLEAMVEEVRSGGMPSPDAELIAAFAAPPTPAAEAAPPAPDPVPKKA